MFEAPCVLLPVPYHNFWLLALFILQLLSRLDLNAWWFAQMRHI